MRVTSNVYTTTPSYAVLPGGQDQMEQLKLCGLLGDDGGEMRWQMNVSVVRPYGKEKYCDSCFGLQNNH